MAKTKRKVVVRNELDMMTVEDLAECLRISVRGVWRQVSSSKLPRPVYIGSLARWPVATIKEWIARDCQSSESH